MLLSFCISILSLYLLAYFDLICVHRLVSSCPSGLPASGCMVHMGGSERFPYPHGCLWVPLLSLAPCSAEAASGAVARSLVSTGFDNNAQVKPCFLASWISFLIQLSTKTHANPLFKPRVCSMSVSLVGTSTYIHIAWTLPVSPTPSRFQSEWEDRHRESDCLLILWLPWGRRKKGPASSWWTFTLCSSLSSRGQWTLWPILKMKLFIFFKVALLLPRRWNLGVF